MNLWLTSSTVRLIDLITRRFWWPDMKKDLKDYISRCPECQLNRSASRTHAPLPIRPVPPVALPFERWGIDFYGPMVENKEWHEFERENSIRHLATTPYHPQTNGMVERMHAMLGHGLTTLVADKRDRWDEYLPQVLLAIRTRTHAVTGFSPFYLLFGTHPRLPNDETPPRSSLMPWMKLKGWRKTQKFIARNLEEVGQARSAANVRTKAQAEAMRKRNGFDEIPQDYYFKVGDMVKMKHHDRQKLEFNWKGLTMLSMLAIQELTGL
ncbi:hypothetical protein BASA81_010362 [Batrachochytrium salamandrivorans]|nr:hypothetical protein BASA81_010362 [Batrachochytrium salamandrivorans]